jgi:DUF1680 family protein
LPRLYASVQAWLCGWGRYRGWCRPESDEQFARRLQAQDQRNAGVVAHAAAASAQHRATVARRLASVPAQLFEVVRQRERAEEDQRLAGSDGERGEELGAARREGVDGTCCVCLSDMEPSDLVKLLPCGHW